MSANNLAEKNHAQPNNRELSTRDLGAFLMDRLRELDQVAYVRFASVYRRFEDIDAFMEELDTLIRQRK